MRRRPLLLLLLCLPTLLRAQLKLEPLQTPTLHVDARIVYVDVVVRDGSGRVVRGLTQDDFHIAEDGAPQKIDLFHAYTQQLAAVPTSPAPSANNLEFSNASAINPSDTVNMILFDLLDTSMANQTYARKQMLKFLTALPPGHRIALFILSDRLHMIQSFTGDSQLLAQAASLLMPKSSFLFQSAGDQARAADILGMSSADMKQGGASSFAMDLAQELSLENFQHEQERNNTTNSAFRELAQASAAYTGRKNLIWLSESFPLGAVSTLQSFPSPYGSPFAGSDLSGPTGRIISDSRIAVYPISVVGLETGGVGASSNGVTAAVGNGAALGGGVAIGNGVNTLDPDTTGGVAASQPGAMTGGSRLPDTIGQQSDSRFALRDQLDDIAQQTGGQAFAGTNDLAGAMSQSLEGGENYYTLAYSPTHKKWNGAFRKIRVELSRKGYSLSYRRGYLALPETPSIPSSAPRQLEFALQPANPELDTIPIQSKVYLPDQTRPSLQVDALLGANDIAFTTAPDGSRTAQLMVEMIAIPDSTRQATMGQTSEELSFHLSAAQYKMAAVSGLPVRLQLALKPGRYKLRLGVSDMNRNRVGTLDMPVDIPAS